MTELLPFLPLVLGMALLAAILLAWHCLNHAHAEDWVLHPRPSFPAAGFSVTDLPVDEFLTLERCWLIRRTTAQLDFVADPNWAFWLRVGRSGWPCRTNHPPPTTSGKSAGWMAFGWRCCILPAAPGRFAGAGTVSITPSPSPPVK